MRIYVVCDLEGTAGVADHRQQCWCDGRGYMQARQWATLELNALVEGALEGGATEIVAWDGHGNLPGGLDIDLVHPACKVVTNGGDGGPLGLDRGWDALMMCGLHAMADTPYGVCDHSFWGDVAAVWLNGHKIGEIGMSCASAGSLGIPLVFLAGDKAGAEEARALVPNIETVAVKEGLRAAGGFNTPALSMSPQRAQQEIRAGARRAMDKIGQIAPWRLDPPYTIRYRFRKAELAEEKAAQPGIARIDEFTVEGVGDDLLNLPL